MFYTGIRFERAGKKLPALPKRKNTDPKELVTRIEKKDLEEWEKEFNRLQGLPVAERPKHYIVNVYERNSMYGWRWYYVCSCGREYDHPARSTANFMYNEHQREQRQHHKEGWK